MPRYTSKDRVYQVGDYWLGQRGGSPGWYRMWWDGKARRTKRASLGTANFETAKKILNDWFVLEQTRPQVSNEEVTLAGVFARFYEHHGQHLKSAADVRRIFRYWLVFHEEATVSEALEADKQADFQKWLIKDKSLSLSSVRKAQTVAKSALNWAWKRGDIPSLPYVALAKAPRPEPKGRPLDIDEVVALFNAVELQHIAVLLAFMLGTAGRTGAILELTYDRIDVAKRLIDLNPEGRVQTKKYRPIVKLPEQLVPYVESRQLTLERNAHVVAYAGKPIQWVKNGWNSTRSRSGLKGNVQTYSCRHTIARWLRMQSVPAWEVAAQLGHKSPEYSTTEIYAPYDPAHLSSAKTAIDDFLCQIARQLRASSISEYLLRFDNK